MLMATIELDPLSIMEEWLHEFTVHYVVPFESYATETVTIPAPNIDTAIQVIYAQYPDAIITGTMLTAYKIAKAEEITPPTIN